MLQLTSHLSGKAAGQERRTPNQFLGRILNRAGLVDGAGRPLVNFHGVRHTAASIAFARGLPLIAISRQLGHAGVAVTSIVYARLIDDRQLDAVCGSAVAV